MYLSPEERAIGKENFCAAVGSKLIRRELLKKTIKTRSVAPGKGLGPLYFHYDASLAEPVRVGVIGTGDEGERAARCDQSEVHRPSRRSPTSGPYNVWRAFNGDHYSDRRSKSRPGLLERLRLEDRAEAKKNVKVYGAYQELIAHAKRTASRQ